MTPPSPAPHLLIVEDDQDIGNLVGRLMTENGYRVTRAGDARTATRQFVEGRFDLVILDLMLPDESGLVLCRRLRALSAVPIVMLTALGAETDRVVGLEIGADDYLVKPFAPRELLARVRAVLRRGPLKEDGRALAAGDLLRFDGWQLSLARRRLVSPAGVQVPLTSGEFDLLALLCQHAGRVLARDRIVKLLHGRAADPFDRRIDLQVARLRRKIEPDLRNPTLIKTIRYSGYVFTGAVTAARDGE